MTMANKIDFLRKCRLCTLTDGELLHIFEEQNLKRNLSAKINECLPIVVRRGDRLPQLICVQCIEKVEQYHAFRNSALCAEIALDMIISHKDKNPLTLELGKKSSDIGCKVIQTEGNEILITKEAEQNILRKQERTASEMAARAVQFKQEVMESIHREQEEITSELAARPELQRQMKIAGAEVRSLHSLSWLGKPGPQDYVLMMEETFKLEKRSSSDNDSNSQIEFENSKYNADCEIVEALRWRKETLPQMWDVFEKTCGEEITTVTHRRYIISKKSFPCSLCGNCFAVSQDFLRHADENLYSPTSGGTVSDDSLQASLLLSCSLCSKVFPQRSSLIRHQRSHSEFRMFACRLCGRAFNRKEHLSRHEASHTGGRPYHCELCHKFFTRKEHLARHRLSHPSTIKCEDQFSESSSTSPESSGNADNSTMDLDPLRPFPCESCGQAFLRKEHLVRHQRRIHSSDSRVGVGETSDELKPFKCTVCHKNFTRKEHLVRHQKIHLREFFLGNRPTIPGTDISLSLVPHSR